VFVSRKDPEYQGKGVDATDIDNNVRLHLASTYANNHKTMRGGNCNKTEEFENGIINGAKWHNTPGHSLIFTFEQPSLEMSASKI